MAHESVFKALADPNRRKILSLLRKHDSLNAGEIAEHFNISKPAISDHLRILRDANLIFSDKQGQYVNYQLNTSVLEELAAYLIDFVKIGKEEE
ncbi:MAG TPA: autorepressor SdpR family transcription factor [Candidatus Cloacimonadota bacterium]|nr:autorepressor SdpR family transcription factor [Candidatus Cloacimonadota bacterium]HPT72410.1 autorepressor SdpR family transcription factor [Candidatus Cloacimonadota bacterium]